MTLHMLDMTIDELRHAVAAAGHKPYRADQLADWVYRKGVVDPARMSNVPGAVSGLFDVLTSRVATEVLVAAPTTYKQLDRPRSFPFSISNTTGEFRRFQLQIMSGTDFATFSPKKDESGVPVDQDTYSVIVFPSSGGPRPVASR